MQIYFYRVSGHFGKHDLTMRIVHSADKDLMISAAQVWCDGEMVVMGHSLGKEQLPRPEQVNVSIELRKLNNYSRYNLL